MYKEFGGLVRVEAAFRRVRGKATKALLDDRVTAKHYHAEQVDAEGTVVVKAGKDARGAEIIEGQDMEYLDYRGPKVFNVYQKQPDIPEEDLVGRFVVVGTHETEEAAEAQAEKIQAELEA